MLGLTHKFVRKEDLGAAGMPLVTAPGPLLVRDVRRSDRTFLWILRTLGTGLFLTLGGIATFLTMQAWPSLTKHGINFLSKQDWDPVHEVFGGLPVIYGTVASSVLALILAIPLSLGVALFITELASKPVARTVSLLTEMIAAIPSVVFGLWGIFVLAPFLRDRIEPWFIDNLGFLGVFRGPPFGVGLFTAGLILSFMIIPTIASICREVFAAVPLSQRNAALALGATRWEMIRLAVLGNSVTGMFGAIFLGFARAFGETMAVTMVIGNRAEISPSIFAPAQTMASLIANEYAEATTVIHRSSLEAIGLTLFLVTLLINLLARTLVKRSQPA